jgi:hypothetical protein
MFLIDANSELKKGVIKPIRKCNRNFDAINMFFDYFLIK